MLKIQEKPYINDLIVIRKFDDDINPINYKITNIKKAKNPMIEVPKMYSEKGSVNTEKLDNNISRAKNKIKEYGYCNNWEYFITLTLDRKKYDRYNLNKFRKDLSQLVKDYRKKGYNIKYLLIPEQHKDGAWHMHGVFMGIPPDWLTKFDRRKKLPNYILSNYDRLFNCCNLSDKFGYTIIEPIRSKERTISYLMKYITKDLERCVKELNLHMYYATKGLNTSDVIKKGTTKCELVIPYNFTNDHVSLYWTKQKEFIDLCIDSITDIT